MEYHTFWYHDIDVINAVYRNVKHHSTNESVSNFWNDIQEINAEIRKTHMRCSVELYTFTRRFNGNATQL